MWGWRLRAGSGHAVISVEVDIWCLPDFKINEREITNLLLAK